MQGPSLLAALGELIADSGDLGGGATAADVLADAGVPSTSVAILEDGEISSACFSTVPMDSDTLFQACSISKTICSATAMRLVDQGKLSIDDKAFDRLPQQAVRVLQHDHNRHLWEQVTVKHLLSHTAGLNLPSFPGYLDKDHVPSSLLDILAGTPGVNTLPLDFISPPGLEFAYSGGSTEVVRLIIEHVTGKSYEGTVKELVFEPLGMNRSCYALAAGEKNYAEAWYHARTICRPSYYVQPELAAAGLWTTPTDLLKLIRAIQQSLNSEDPQHFLRRATASQMLHRVSAEMGLAWFVAPIAFGHPGGNNPGYRCFYLGFADLSWNRKAGEDDDDDDDNDSNKTDDEYNGDAAKLPLNSGVAIMTNSKYGEDKWWPIMRAIFYLKGWPSFPAFGAHHDPNIPFAVKAEANPRWRDWAGRWSRRVSIQEDSKGRPLVDFGRGGEPFALVPAAMPPHEYRAGQGVDLVVKGMSMMIRLRFEGDERVVEVWSAGNGTIWKCKPKRT